MACYVPGAAGLNQRQETGPEPDGPKRPIRGGVECGGAVNDGRIAFHHGRRV